MFAPLPVVEFSTLYFFSKLLPMSYMIVSSILKVAFAAIKAMALADCVKVHRRMAKNAAVAKEWFKGNVLDIPPVGPSPAMMHVDTLRLLAQERPVAS